ncbi:LOW QUALITY PROTEIN: beta-1,4-N-acetylgalactosaminyltransferase 3 [Plectropomus leopardus]|uniref:LOW QUALITY PROTEIN: beta-1,4-N-acetylgalactosaminyltransferase 3 n=1 Tax=Plectropomus leopardus TaxID=160734 RepID=UPI001C4ADA6E|nr:LOW QUALITY PROTEIN: beta-1,4-N-acetylgalactosaminyltransferase 3 [Plectropomus leopardus]
MIAAFFPLKKLRRNGRYFLFGAILLVGAVAVYHEMVAAKAWSSDASMSLYADGGSWRRAMFVEGVRRGHRSDSAEHSDTWRSSYMPQTWKPEYKGQANLHVFEDWCGSSTADLFKNLHYPLYPHTRTTVSKLAVSPQWTNYGLRIFGYLHPYTDGEFVIAVSSDDNSELWLSTDDSPVNMKLLALVGKTGTEWTAPGEFDKYASQTSKPVWLSSQKRYFFEVIHKQNDRGTDHVEVAWQLLDRGKFMVIDSSHISLYVNESALLMSDIAHIPQTAASHQHIHTKQHNAATAADLLREDPRDTLYHVPLINSKFLRGVLPDCSYKPSYIIKDFPLLRYQGLQFVHMSYIYPKDYTRLTHMETESSCFYPESPYYMKMFGFSRYMRLDRSDTQETRNMGRDFGFQRRKSVLEEEDELDNEAYRREREAWSDRVDNNLFPDYGDDYDDYANRRRRKLFSLVVQETNHTLSNTSDSRLHTDELQRRQKKDSVPQPQPQKPAEPLQATQASKHSLQQSRTDVKLARKAELIKPKGKLRPAKRQKLKSVEATGRVEQTSPLIAVHREQFKAIQRPAVAAEQLSFKQHGMQRSRKMNRAQIQRLKDSKLQPLVRDAPPPVKPTETKQQRFPIREMELQPATTKRSITAQRDMERPVVRLNQRDTDTRKHLREKDTEMKMPLPDLENSIHRPKMIKGKVDKKHWEGVGDGTKEKDQVHNRAVSQRDTWEGEQDNLWGLGGDYEGADDENVTPAPVFDSEVNWSQTFQVGHLDLQAQRLDSIDLHCNVSGNLLLGSSDALATVKAFMDQLNTKHHGRFTLVRVVNVVKRVDGVRGSRYLLELELKDDNGQLLRLSHYIYTLIRYSRQRSNDFSFQQAKPQLVMCNPVGFRWNPVATVHFIVPVKNQARWVQQLITDMEQLFRATGDTNFNLIIADYNSTDMDVRKALQKSSLLRYQYVKLSGNFERSAGLQAGIDLINDDHSIVFLCDLHIHFPPSIIDTIRKHCVEGYMAFAPIVLRLDCGATPLDARGYWEVNGFGLLGIYKSDLDAVGGMNTREFRDRWGGEDWELLDRILQAGLEVERIYLRNFFHHYHSKRGMWNRRVSPSHR